MSGSSVIASNKTKLKFVPISAVKMRDGFWKTKMDLNHRRGLPVLLKHLQDHGVIDNFMLVSGRKHGERQGPYFSDSDLFKWMEGAAWDLTSYPDPQRRAELDCVVDEVVAAQGEDGYLNTFFQGELYAQRFRDLPREHELYCAGHMFQAAIAHYRATGEDKFLNCATRYADYLAQTFGPGKLEGVDGHPEIEMALVELYRTTGKRSYLDLAGFFLGKLKFTDMPELKGHAVRAMYTTCGGADYYVESGDAAHKEASERLWEDLVSGKLYITGGFGSRYAGEATGFAYELPNLHAYAETCAAIANAMWQYRMLGIYADAKFADEMERALYNGIVSGVSLDGSSYFYVNPLTSTGTHFRKEWFGCTCCPTNMVRFLASIPGYMYSTSAEGVWVHLFENSVVDHRLADGTAFTLEQETGYPFAGDVRFSLGLKGSKQFTLFLRIPGWCAKAQLRVNGESVPVNLESGKYAAINRAWHDGDTVELSMSMPAVLMEADARVREDLGDVCVARGPLVYCAETPDNPNASILDLQLTSDSFELTDAADLPGVVMLRGQGIELQPSQVGGPLYRRVGPKQAKKLPITFVPYYAWCNRGQSQMTVWMPFRR